MMQFQIASLQNTIQKGNLPGKELDHANTLQDFREQLDSLVSKDGTLGVLCHGFLSQRIDGKCRERND